jgi:acyl transferase domain-containing protein
MSASLSGDIAIVGLACRYPGEARSPEAFAAMLKGGRDAWSKIPKDRFDIDAYHHPSHERQGNIVAEGGYFLEEDIGLFDAPFFSMTAAEGTLRKIPLFACDTCLPVFPKKWSLALR